MVKKILEDFKKNVKRYIVMLQDRKQVSVCVSQVTSSLAESGPGRKPTFGKVYNKVPTEIRILVMSSSSGKH